MNNWSLKVLQTVIDTGSLQSAAQQLHRTSPALSMTLKKLEDELGFQVLDRSQYRLHLTERGKLFMRHARELLRQQERLESVVVQLRDEGEPQLRIALDAGMSGLVVKEAVMKIQEQFPATELRVSGYSQLNSLKQVAEGLEDFAVCPWIPTFHQVADFESIRIGQFNLVAVMSSYLVKQFGMPKKREDLAEHAYILPQEMNLGINPEQIYKLPGRSQIRVNDVRTLVEFLNSGMGWGIAPRQMIAGEIAKGQLVEIHIPGFLDHVQLEFHLLRLASKQLGPAGQLFWQHFIDRERFLTEEYF
ncbi:MULTISPECIES: LysR family transcriptional regulator [Gammaproteobacteria]|uniref:LysR family transcriptional regulator n=1 Tax=Gammaproteobacteria TaxID=1236 RepID=UPI000DD07718|nr:MULTISPECIES: LysR family transcriptional regulator [Gammaproteobacteria]RTE86270.1 LysR family transcriptional regulator [Aliidiomarina sp. B3213]TCZ91621.1 LysR family transcriptional regulator [Lysobacter sp. N42]